MIELKELFPALGPFLLYAELHPRLFPFPNILNRRFPEILADAPSRINRNSKLPILVLVKDSHLYPVELISVMVEMFQAGEKIREWEFLDEIVPPRSAVLASSL